MMKGLRGLHGFVEHGAISTAVRWRGIFNAFFPQRPAVALLWDIARLRPREYFQRQIYASYWFENESTPRTVELLGGDNVMFETDFPHPTCLYPHVREQVQASLGGLDRSRQRKVLYETVAKVYNLPLPV